MGLVLIDYVQGVEVLLLELGVTQLICELG